MMPPTSSFDEWRRRQYEVSGFDQSECNQNCDLHLEGALNAIPALGQTEPSNRPSY